MTDLEENCICPHPYRRNEKLWLCGSEMCTRLLNSSINKLKNGYHTLHETVPNLVISEEDEQK